MPTPPQEKEMEKIIQTPEIPSENFEEKNRGEIQTPQQEALPQEIISPAPPDASQEAQGPKPETKDEILIGIEKILSSEIITEIYNELPSRNTPKKNVMKGMPFKEDFLHNGEAAAIAMHENYEKGEITVHGLENSVHEWLLMLPEAESHDPALEQEELDMIRSLKEYFEKLLQKPIEE